MPEIILVTRRKDSLIETYPRGCQWQKNDPRCPTMTILVVGYRHYGKDRLTNGHCRVEALDAEGRVEINRAVSGGWQDNG
jgi:hypothetical protein